MTKKQQVESIVKIANKRLTPANSLLFVDMGKSYFLSYWGFGKKHFSNATKIEFVEKWVENYITVCDNDRQGNLAI